MSIPTPATAEKINELSQAQIKFVRDSLGILEEFSQPDNSYIIFDAVAGNNNLHIGVGASSTYIITLGDGTQPISYTDTGGTKILSFGTTGRYVIRIEGTFNGIDTNGVSQAEKDKYIAIIAGTNYPTTLPAYAFYTCLGLKYVDLPHATVLGTFTFAGCAKLEYVNAPKVTTIGDSTFSSCTVLKEIYFPVLTNVPLSGFTLCEALKEVYLPSATSFGNSAFDRCYALIKVDAPLVASIGLSCFANCANLIEVYLKSVTNIGQTAFNQCLSLKILEVGIVTVTGSNAFSSVNLADLIVNGTSTNAASVTTQFIANNGFFLDWGRTISLNGNSKPGIFSANGIVLDIDSVNSSSQKVNLCNGGTVVGIWGANATDCFIAYSSAGFPRINVAQTGNVTLPAYSGTGTEDAQFTSSGAFTRITSDEKTKDIIGKLKAGLDYILAAAKNTIEFKYKKKDLNAKNSNYWGFGARGVIEAYGKNPAFRIYKDIYGWDAKQMIAPLCNAIAEQQTQIEDLRKRIENLEKK